MGGRVAGSFVAAIVPFPEPRKPRGDVKLLKRRVRRDVIEDILPPDFVADPSAYLRKKVEPVATPVCSYLIYPQASEIPWLVKEIDGNKAVRVVESKSLEDILAT